MTTTKQRNVFDAYERLGPSATLVELAREAGCSTTYVHNTLAKIGVFKRPRHEPTNVVLLRKMKLQFGLSGCVINALPAPVFDRVVGAAVRKREPFTNALARLLADGSLRISLDRGE